LPGGGLAASMLPAKKPGAQNGAASGIDRRLHRPQALETLSNHGCAERHQTALP